MNITGFKLFLVDETHCWADDITKALNQKIYGAYLIYDPTCLVHICSFTPSLESSFVCNYFHEPVKGLSEEKKEEIFDSIFLPHDYNEIGEYHYFGEKHKSKALSLDEILIGVDENWFEEIGVKVEEAYDEGGYIHPHVIAMLLNHWDSTSGTMQNYIDEKFGDLTDDSGNN